MVRVIRLLVVLIAIAGTYSTVSGDTAQIRGTGALIEVTDVRDRVNPGNQFVEPEPGQRFLGIQVVIDNTNGDSEITANPLFFHVKDADGTVYGASIMSGAIMEPGLAATEVDGGDLIRGWVSFELPTEIEIADLSLRYETFTEKSDWIEIHPSGIGEPRSNSPKNGSVSPVHGEENRTYALAISRCSQCLDSYEAYAETQDLGNIVDGTRHASAAVELFRQYQIATNKELDESTASLAESMEALSDNIPTRLLNGHPQTDWKNETAPLLTYIAIIRAKLK